MKNLLLAALCSCTLALQAQTISFRELTDSRPKPTPEAWQDAVPAPHLDWGNIDTRYAKFALPAPKRHTGTLRLYAWRGESVNAQALLSTPQTLTAVKLTAGALKNGKAEIPAEAIHTAFVRYVMTDEYGGGCGYRPDKTQYDSSIVADILDSSLLMDTLEARTTRPLWLRIQVPADTRPGTYKGTLTVQAEGMQALTLPYELRVSNRTLPPASTWEMHLDLWQNPYASARLYNVPLWSEAHFAAMRPNMERLAAAGQKVITTTIMNRAWNGQTQDPFCSMVTRIRHLDGSWSFDYAVFDRWVEWMMSLGIDKQINCYTVVPWALRFDYYDEASNSVQYIHAAPGSAEYEAYWLPFLKDFARHLKEKGWFERTHIALDERARDQMDAAFKVVFKADPDFRISGAARYYPDVEPHMDDLCLAYGQHVPTDVLARRRAEGKLTTVYTCCTEARPNMFTFSPPAEATWLPWHALAADYDGYLRWAYNSWTIDPLADSRFRSWPAGDTYMVYPNGWSSIRMERLIEGMQDVEKVRLLRKEFTDKGQKAKLRKLDAILTHFQADCLTEDNAATLVNEARHTLRALE